MGVRLGDLLIRRGVLTPRQRDRILKLQEERARPFGALAEEVEGVAAADVEEAWADQYASMADRVDPRRLRIDPRVLEMLTEEEAREHGVLPVRQTDGGLVACTTRGSLVRAVAYTGRRFTDLCLFVLAEEQAFSDAVRMHYGGAMAR